MDSHALHLLILFHLFQSTRDMLVRMGVFSIQLLFKSEHNFSCLDLETLSFIFKVISILTETFVIPESRTESTWLNGTSERRKGFMKSLLRVNNFLKMAQIN